MAPISPELQRKQDQLRRALAEEKSLVIAFSGGVDSSYLAYEAHRVLGDRALAMTALSPSYPAHHREAALAVVEATGLAHRFVSTHEMDRPAYRRNAADRCYHCKTELFDVLEKERAASGFAAVAYGINVDDTGDYRPGHRAAEEHAVRAPLLDAGLCKEDVRALARVAELPTADLPASACLASRLPYGTAVSPERLAAIERAEEAVRGLGFHQLRVRHHGELARIEIAQNELPRALDPVMAKKLSSALRALGFRYVALDLEGYRQGSLNAVLVDPPQ